MENVSGKVVIEEVDGVTIATLGDQRILDELHIAKIGKTLNQCVVGLCGDPLVVDFNSVTNMSSSALGMLLTLHKHVCEDGGKLVLCNIQPTIADVFRITRLDNVFDIVSSRAEALAQVQ
jgi:anti-anti-sigma factor